MSQMKINRLMTVICSEDLPGSKAFYTGLFDFEIAFDSDWFIQLTAKGQPLEIGIIDANSQVVPKGVSIPSQGFYLTFVVDNVEAVYEQAKSKGMEILQEPTDTFYGQRQLLLKDPNGTTVDISAPIPNFNPG